LGCLRHLGETARRTVERDIEIETEMAIVDVLADAITADMVERFRHRYDLSDLLGYAERGLDN